MRPRMLALGVAAVILVLAVPAWAANFTPTATFALSTKLVNANPTLTVGVKQDQGEEELAKVILAIPHGFKLPPDSAIDDGEKLGQGSITIALAPACSTTETVNVNIVERNRTQAEKNAGVYAVWVVDLHPVTTIDLKIKGNPTNGWKATGAIAPNDATCPPFQFHATINKTSSSSHVKLIRNPANAGTYTLKITFVGENGSKVTRSKAFSITS